MFPSSELIAKWPGYTVQWTREFKMKRLSSKLQDARNKNYEKLCCICTCCTVLCDIAHILQPKGGGSTVSSSVWWSNITQSYSGREQFRRSELFISDCNVSKINWKNLGSPNIVIYELLKQSLVNMYIQHRVAIPLHNLAVGQRQYKCSFTGRCCPLVVGSINDSCHYSDNRYNERINLTVLFCHKVRQQHWTNAAICALIR